MAIRSRGPRVLSLYSGYGGIDLGVRLAMPGTRTVCHVEREASAAHVLVTQIEAGRADPAPIWSDSSTFDGRPWRGSVDLITAGFPCQPASIIGARKGTADPRWLWSHIARIVGQVRPSAVFLENVAGLVSVSGGEAWAEVLGGLSALGFDAAWTSVRASDAGAPHQRRRLFVLAHANGQSGDLRDWLEHHPAGGVSDPGELADAARPRSQGPRTLAESGPGDRDVRHGFPPGPRSAEWADILSKDPWLAPALSRADRLGLAIGVGMVEPDVRPREQRALGRAMAKAVVAASAQSSVRRMVDGAAEELDRTPRLMLLGNGVVPAQAGLAFLTLAHELLLEN